MWARGARSPLAPREPFSGITGWTPALSMSRSSSRVARRTPEWPRARVLARISMMARVVARSKGSPTPTAWLMTMLRCSSSTWSGGMIRSLKAPKPVVMP